MLNDENKIISLAKQGNRKALGELVTHYSPKIYNLGLRLMRNETDAEDVLQETFLKMVTKIDTFKGNSSLYTWLYRVATNVALEKMRDKHHINLAYSLDDPDYPEMGSNESFSIPEHLENKLSDKEFRKYLDTAIKELNENLRTIFILRDIEGNSVSDTAEILNISESNVKVRLMRARLSLREKFAEYFKNEGLV
ncbi:MAG: sigma-70 family RNA polymerase sigma factor [Candidatus Marinimicrobia bacterium]|nr:sigma-70 family RNA polymerase sigma factor [Candidatus Neomarinimicrobiota bacterium]MBL7022960.1 sigma-70 family RNA polymerase sigma factor [Candidatus Neomarinimicrobiota bacterium]MBL7108778.1 sigma-70 family RNA polymerase sigma factor [Candidatus Neomarinimicrobiota bacterium]